MPMRFKLATVSSRWVTTAMIRLVPPQGHKSTSSKKVRLKRSAQFIRGGRGFFLLAAKAI